MIQKREMQIGFSGPQSKCHMGGWKLWKTLKELSLRDWRWQLVPNFKSKYTSSTNCSECWEKLSEHYKWKETMRPWLEIARSQSPCSSSSIPAVHVNEPVNHQFSRNLDTTVIPYWPATVRYWNFTEVLKLLFFFVFLAEQPEAVELFSEPGLSFAAAFCAALWFSPSEFLCKYRTRTREIKKGPFQDFPATSASHVLARISPGHTFTFRQNTAAQAEQRGESEPRRETGRHRVFLAPGEALSFHGNNPVFRFTQTLEKGVSFFISAVNETSPGLGNFDSSSSSRLTYNSELAQREDTHSWTPWRHREGGQMLQQLFRYTRTLLVLSALHIGRILIDYVFIYAHLNSRANS